MAETTGHVGRNTQLREHVPSPAILVVGKVVRQAQAWADLQRSLETELATNPLPRKAGQRA